MLSKHNYWQNFSTGLHVSVSECYLQAQMLITNVNIEMCPPHPYIIPFNVKRKYSACLQFSNRPIEHNTGLFRLFCRNSEGYVQNASPVLYDS